MQLCPTRNMRKLAVGQAVHAAMCYVDGGMIDDRTVVRLGDANLHGIGRIGDVSRSAVVDLPRFDPEKSRVKGENGLFDVGESG